MKHICKYCGKEFDTGQKLGGHIVLCKENPNNCKEKIKEHKEVSNNLKNPKIQYKLICPICNNEFEINITKKQYESGKYRHTCSSICSHKLTTKNTDLKERNINISNSSPHISTRKGCTKVDGKWIKNENYIDPKDKRNCLTCNKEYYSKILNNGKYSSSKFCCDECRKIYLSNNAKIHKVGGLKINSYKKYKSGTYHNIHCDSSWELAFIIYCEEHNINVKRNTKYFEYVYNNKIFKYYPDFEINGILYEIKGYENDKAKEKHRQYPNIIYLNKEKMKPYIDYVVNKYGKNYIELYDKIDNKKY